MRRSGVDTVVRTSNVAFDTFCRSVVELDHTPGTFFEDHNIIFTVDVEERGGKGRREQGFADLSQRDERPNAYPLLAGCGSNLLSAAESQPTRT